LKLDRLFVAGLGESSEDETIAGSVIHLAHELGLEAVAEGVETLDQLHALDTLGCDLAQGFYWSRPLPAGEIELVLLEGRKLGPRTDAESRVSPEAVISEVPGGVIPGVRAAS
jgi:EAL domain-containing protein (putative c-di-GMP-specific phosphodiesterase class I)